MLALKKIYKAFTPPILDNQFRLLLKKIIGKGGYFSGPYQNWEKAKQQATGYDALEIIHKVRQSALIQKQNKGFVRDGVELDKPDHAYPLLTALLFLLLKRTALNIIDFGGGLGSTYYNCKSLITDEKFNIIWNIVEQPHFVKIGQLDHQADKLFFFDNIDFVEAEVDMMILSGVLQYLPNVFELINTIKLKKYPYIFIDRMITHLEGAQSTSIMVERVPTYIYKASYPCRVFNYTELLSHFLDQYDVVYDFTANEGQQNLGNLTVLYRGDLLKLK